MCEHCSTIQVDSVKLGVYVRNYNYDPTRTTALRNAFVKDFNKRFNSLAKKITQDIGQDDILNLTQGLAVNAAFGFPTSEAKVSDFMGWLQNQVDDGLLEVRKLNGGTAAANAAWTNLYVEDSYNRGVQRARYEMKKVGYKVPTIEESGGIQVVTGTPFHMDRVGLLYSRTYEELKGITSAMSTQLGRVLSQGMIDGKGPKDVARLMNKAMTGMGADLSLTDTLGRFIPAKRRAVIMARTEMIRAHHQGMVNEMENWGVHGVSVKAEFTTAGDDRVCPTCAGLEGKIYELAESRNMIPVHPQCRCIVLPTRPDGTAQNVKKVVKDGPTADYDKVAYMRSNGWSMMHDTTKAFDEGRYKDFNKGRYKDFDFKKFDEEFAKIFPDTDNIEKFVMFDKGIKGKPDTTFLTIHLKSSKVELIRSFTGDTVTHTYLELDKMIQGQGKSKQLFDSLLEQYENLKIKTIEVHANIDVGGYAWAKYGFKSNQNTINNILKKLDSMEASSDVNTLRSVLEDLKKTIGDSPYDVYDMSIIADSPLGKELLLDSDWYGSLDLTNKVQAKRFYDYTGRKMP